ncbi:fatty-acyl-CoA synthase [Dietzia kunjamensis subsp. schimae]|uniref:Fatty-acyl-CoA synthase n=1 Tax=Dietzia kunjamensis subsp. schimae TaxID=498198 RepID=A0ABY1MWI7_9ACTN|nr:long-chain-fatty-acid--CoA ligase [Dietzia maris]MBB1014053.1 long-chain-fatty-acid--CoA ligase [Dietzia kunjamensis subsp. schimae]SMO37978.1 fatty-acyl-CoA synthase [Dietzia kunjamensis subsp. schimae]
MLGTMLDTPLLVSRILEHAAERHGGSTVTGFVGDLEPRPVRYDVLASRAAATAHALAGLGVRPGDVVGILSGSRTEVVEAMFALPAMGAVALPVNVLRSREFMLSVLSDNRVAVVLVDPELLSSALPVAAQLDSLRHLVVVDGQVPPDLGELDADVHALETLLDGQPTTYPWPDLDERSAAAIAYTSGTTGASKGVAYTHRSIWLHSMQMSMAESAALRSGDTVLTTVPMYHVMSWGLPYAAFMTGAGLITARPRPGRVLTTGHDMADLLRTYRPNKMATTPATLQRLLRRLENNPQSIAHLSEVLVGGSPVPEALFDAFVERHGVTIMQAYGLTESSPIASFARPDPHSSATRRRAQMLGQGRFPAGVKARIVDGGRVQHNDGWSVGELQIRGPWVTARYLGDEASDRFVDGWLRTGDVASISPKGYLDVVDRVDDIIASGGELISTVELEHAILLDDRVAEVAVVGVPDERWGNRPLVLVLLKTGATASARSLWEGLEGVVENWKRPDHWAFVDHIPQTTVGKFDKIRIRARHAAGDYEVTTIAPEASG